MAAMPQPLPSLHYDRAGQPITVERWRELFHQRSYRMLAVSYLGRPVEVRVATIWTGVDHSLGEAEHPLIYESLVCGGNLDGECVHSATAQEAQAVHDNLVKLAHADLEDPW